MTDNTCDLIDPHTVEVVSPVDRHLVSAVRLGEDMIASSPTYQHMQPSVAKLIRFAYDMRADENSFFHVAVRNDKVIGFIVGSLAAYGFHDDTFAYDRMLYVTPNARRSSAARMLITAFEQWAIEKGAARVLLGITTGVHTDTTEAFYNKMGYDTVGVLTMKELR